MNFFTNLINFSLEKDMGIYNLTDEFFCVYLNSIRLKNNNITYAELQTKTIQDEEWL